MIKRCDLSRYEEEWMRDISPYDKEYFEVELVSGPLSTELIKYGYRDVQQGEGLIFKMGPWIKIKDAKETHE